MAAKNKIVVSLPAHSADSDQFYYGYSRKSQLEGEKKLMLAVLEDAILCFLSGTSRCKETKKRDLEEAERWIFEENGEGPFSFETVCEALGLNPMWIRKQLLREKNRYRKKGCAHTATKSSED